MSKSLSKQQSISDKSQRSFNVNTYTDPLFQQTEVFSSNRIRTAKYNILTFLPLALFYQFSSYFNLFFLVNAILLSIPEISSLSPLSAFVPFIVVLCINLLREALEDIRKHQYDRQANNSISITFKVNKFEETKWSDMLVGDIIKIKKNEILPVDILIIKSSEKNGFCYLETTNLDGENTLKPREALLIPQRDITDESSIATLFAKTEIEVDKPNLDIYNIEGTAFLQGKAQEKSYFNINNILLRGGRLKNVDYVYGIIIYTGKDTKLMKNINHSSKKESTVTKKLNMIVLIIAIIVLLLCIICTIMGGLDRQRNLPNYEKNLLNADYIYHYNPRGKADSVLEIVRIFTGNFAIFSTLVPMSIVIVLACVNSYQTAIMEFLDPDLKQDEGDRVQCFSLSLQEEMGMVKYIFTDKTGTLTRNEMEFKACSIFNTLFDDDNNDAIPVDNMTNHRTAFTLSTFTTNTASRFSKTFNKNMIFENLYKDIPIMLNNQAELPFKSFRYAVVEFLFNLCLNHNVLSEYDNEKQGMIFQGANPDEVTLVTAAAELGFRFQERDSRFIKIKVNILDLEQIKTFDILQMFEFTSTRQRSSIIIKDNDTNEIKLYLKGSDRKVFESINQFSQDNILPITKEHVDSFARRGLRTLCYSYKVIPRDVYEDWKKQYDELKYQCINDKTLYSQLEDTIGIIESNTVLLGVTALEDKLQDGVKEDLQSFIDAGINVWMITGDKMDTAESIGHSCKLFSDDTEIFKIKDCSSERAIIKRMSEIKEEMKVMDAELKQLSMSDDFKGPTPNSPIKDQMIAFEQELKHQQTHVNDKDLQNKENIIILQGNSHSNHYNQSEEQLDIDPNDIHSNHNHLPEYNSGDRFQDNDSNKRNQETLHDNSILKYMMDKNFISNSNQKYDNMSIIQGKVIKASGYEDASLNNNNQKNNKHKTPVPVNQDRFIEYLSKCKKELMKYKKMRRRKNLKDRLKFWHKEKEDNSLELKMNFGLIIEGQAISQCIKPGEAEELFWELIQKSRSLICCRCSPIQKAQVVEFIKKKSGQTTLAIGDGGNDVNMIKTANVGIGLFGKEGYQAAFNSDYAISQFKYLKRLIFYNGHFALERNSYFLYFYYFKNVLFTIPQFCLCFFNGFCGGNLYDDWYYMGYNSFITVLPISSRAVCDEDFDPDFKNYPVQKELLQTLVPDIYKQYRDKVPFNILHFFYIFLVAAIFSIPNYLIPAYAFEYGIQNATGLNYSYWDISLATFLSILGIHFFIIIADSAFFNWVQYSFYAVQLATDILFFIIYDLCNYSDGISGDLFFIINNLHFWIVMFLPCVMCIIPFYIYRRFEYFFGNMIVERIKSSKCEEYYIEKYYKKKITMMTKATRSVAKFKKIYKLNKVNEYENIVDQQMKKIVDEFKQKKKEIKEKHKAQSLANRFSLAKTSRNMHATIEVKTDIKDNEEK